MKIQLITIGKTSAPYLKEGISIYLKRLEHYAKLEYKELADVPAKGLTPDALKKKEGLVILEMLKPDDVLILLDENGKHFTSREFADFIQKKMNAGVKQIIFVIGGAFGFSPEVYARANAQISFSKMTLSHEMIRLFLVEQLYRAHTILKGESYHHD
jgi:23S rRNA (pseudouridine1915-N3)-methyltransferase